MEEITSLPLPQKQLPEGGRHSPILLLASLFLILISLSTAGYLYFQNMRLSSQLTTITSSPTPFPVASVDPTASWQTYTATDKKYSFRYPSDWKIQEKNGEVLIFPTGYREGTFFTLEPINSNFDSFLQKKSRETNCELKSGETKVTQNNNLQVASAYNECNDQIYGFYYINGSPNILISHHVNDSGYLESVGAILSTFKFINQTQTQNPLDLLKKITQPMVWSATSDTNIYDATGTKIPATMITSRVEKKEDDKVAPLLVTNSILISKYGWINVPEESADGPGLSIVVYKVSSGNKQQKIIIRQSGSDYAVTLSTY